MLKEERFAKLLDILEKEQFATVQSLSKRLETSMPTIRRDLTELAQQNRIIRSHGGAMCVNEKQIITPLDYRKSINAKDKSLLSKAAVKFLDNASVVFLDASTTVAYMMDYISELRDVIILTNSLPAAIRLRNLGFRTYCLGGEVISSSIAVGGRFAIDTVSSFNIDVMFFSSHGINSNGMIVDTSESENELRRYVLQHAGTNVFLCDKAKFNVTAAFNLASLSCIDYVITNAPLPSNYPAPRQKVIVV